MIYCFSCLKLTMTVLILRSVIILLSMKTGRGLKQPSTCWPVCSGNECMNVYRDRVDFGTAVKACGDRKGELLTLHSDTDDSILDYLSQELSGHFWIGLSLPAGACSNLSSPLRGYQWLSGRTHRSFIPSSGAWKDSTEVCSPRCVSVSNNQKWTERLCSDKTDGYLCRTKHKDACQAQELSDPYVFQSSKGCLTGPCEHECKDVKGGYICSCFKGYIPDSKDLRKCKIWHCGNQKCPVVCDRLDPFTCYCPDGYVKNDRFCEDINECEMGECDQECKNTFGSFECSCREGFVLENQYKCIRAVSSESYVITTPVEVGLRPAASNNTLKQSSAEGVLWIWILAAVALVVLICVVRFYVVKRQKRREQTISQQSAATAPTENSEC